MDFTTANSLLGACVLKRDLVALAEKMLKIGTDGDKSAFGQQLEGLGVAAVDGATAGTTAVALAIARGNGNGDSDEGEDDNLDEHFEGWSMRLKVKRMRDVESVWWVLHS